MRQCALEILPPPVYFTPPPPFLFDTLEDVPYVWIGKLPKIEAGLENFAYNSQVHPILVQCH